jgi:hypothetical protein
MDDIIELQEISPNNWQAKYQGNYGRYTIKIKTDGKKIMNFSCSCPSSHYPCKHIAMIKEAIDERIAMSNESAKGGGITIETLLQNVPLNELRDFIIRQAKYNSQLTQTILLEFAPKIKTDRKKGNDYSAILRQALKNVAFDYEEIYNNDYSLEIDILGQWLDKAQSLIKQGNYREAVLISKACIEEYASWLEHADSDFIDYLSEEYEDTPFTKSPLSSLKIPFSLNITVSIKPRSALKNGKMN